MTPDERRSAHLLFGEEIALGELDPAVLLDNPTVLDAVRSRGVPSPLTRNLQRLAVKRGTLTFDEASVEPMLGARTAVLGDAAAGTPRLLVRVDEFPHAQAADRPERYATAAFARFHEILTRHEIPYLTAVLPHVPHDYLNPRESSFRYLASDEIEMLQQLARDGVCFGLHGLDHRTVNANPRRHSELRGRPAAELLERLDRAEAAVGQHGIHPRVFVAPFNRFDLGQYQLLAKRFDVVTGGPESVPLIGWHASPLWRGEAVYLPSYAPLYDRAGAVRAAVEDLARREAALWIPIVLHWGWEADDGWEDLIALCRVMRGLARPWDEFLAAVDASSAGLPEVVC